jgi:co-chaperonin GroES (HSP10)
MAITGIVHTTDDKQEPTTGVVFATGPDCRVVTRGMRVMFDRFAGTEYEVDGRKWRIMKEIYPIMSIQGSADIHVKPAAWNNS